MKARLLTTLAGLGLIHCFPATAGQGPYEDPDATGTVGLFTVPRAATLAPGHFGIGVFYQTLSREEGASNVERGALTFTYGAVERFEVFAAFEPRTGVRRDFIAEDALGIPRLLTPPLNDHPLAQDHFQHGVGDLRVGAKLKLIGDPEGYGGLAAAAGIKFATADDEAGIGTGKTDYGFDLIAGVEAAETLGLNASLGVELKGDPEAFAIADEMRYGLGVEVPTRTALRGIFELTGVRYINQPEAFRGGFQDYTVIQGGARLSLGNGLALSGGINRTLTIDDPPGVGHPDIERIGSFLQISFTTRPPVYAAAAPNRAPSLSCRAEVTSTRRGESVRLLAEARDADGDAVTVRWSASAGTVTPAAGTDVTWSSSGVGTGTVVNITAVASDGKDLSDHCSIRVSVEAPPAPPPVATVRRFECTDFGAGSARLDNRCKAVLDDVAVLLRSDRRATVRVSGHRGGGAAEGRRGGLAAERAESARLYLMQTHSIDRSRIEAGAASDRPEGGDGAEGRRIDLVLTIP